MSRVKIISDSTCDLSPRLLAVWEISVLPLHIIMGSDVFTDGKDITADEIYKWADDNRTTPKTSAPTPAEAVLLMKPYLDDGYDLVCFSISDSMSSSGNVMRMAAQELQAEDRVHVIDSMNLSTGVGLQVIEAAAAAKRGDNASEIETAALALRSSVRASFVVDTLTYLYRGGRCGGLSALAGSVLHLHPKIIVENGAMKADKKYRGSKMSRVILQYAGDMEQELLNARPDRVFITHSGVSGETIEEVKNYLHSLHHFKEILVTRAGGVITSHCGPGTLGVLFIADQQQSLTPAAPF